MTDKGRFDRFAFNLAGRHFTGKQTVSGIALGVSLFALYRFRKFLAGGSCNIEKDLTGKNVLITGGNSGIGKETARRLLELNATIIIGSRDEKKNRETIEELSKIGKGKIVSYKLDLSDRKSIEEFVGKVKKEVDGEPLHYLLNNAGIMGLINCEKTKEGCEKQIGTNHFGHFYLTYLLWDKLKQSGNPRIVNVSSRAHRTFTKVYDLDMNNLYFQNGGYESWAAYSRSKKANILFTKELQKRMTQANVNGTCVALHPGVVRTDLPRDFTNQWWRKIAYGLLYPFMLITFKTASQGAQTSLYCLL